MAIAAAGIFCWGNTQHPTGGDANPATSQLVARMLLAAEASVAAAVAAVVALISGIIEYLRMRGAPDPIPFEAWTIVGICASILTLICVGISILVVVTSS